MRTLSLRYCIWWILMLWTVLISGIYFYLVAQISPQRLPRLYRRLCQRLHAWTVLLIPIEMIGMDALQANTQYIITANHQSFSDTPLLMASLGYHGHAPRFIMKECIRYFPILPIYAYYLKFLYLSRTSPKKALQQIRHAAQETTEIQDWLLFPEGTRAKLGTVLPAKTAGLHWLMQSFPQHVWVDMTVIYHASGIKIIATAMPRPAQHKDLEACLHAQYLAKIAHGLSPADGAVG